MHEILLALDHHELVKIRVNAEDREPREAMIAEICAATDAALGPADRTYRHAVPPKS
jgi:RNA-binding protein